MLPKIHQVCVILFLTLSVWGGELSAQPDAPISVIEGNLYQVYPSNSAHENYDDATARGMVALKNGSSSHLKGVEVKAQFFHPEGQLLFIDRQTADIKPKGDTDVYFVWANPSRSPIDHVKLFISGKSGGKDFSIEHTLKYPNPQYP